MFYERKDIKGRKKEEKDRISIFIFFYLFIYFYLFFYFFIFFIFFFIVFPNESVVIYFMLLYARLSS